MMANTIGTPAGTLNLPLGSLMKVCQAFLRADATPMRHFCLHWRQVQCCHTFEVAECLHASMHSAEGSHNTGAPELIGACITHTHHGQC